MIQKGKLIEFRGTWGSGIGNLSIKVDGVVRNYPCDNGATVRSLESAFGNVITEGHTASGDGYKGKEVFFSVDEFGLLEGFTPVEEASPEVIEQFDNQEVK